MISDNMLLAFVTSLKIMALEGQRTEYTGPHAAAVLRDLRGYLTALEALRKTVQGYRVRDELDETIAELTRLKASLQFKVKQFEADFVKSVEEDQNKLLQLHADWDVTVGDGIE